MTLRLMDTMVYARVGLPAAAEYHPNPGGTNSFCACWFVWDRAPTKEFVGATHPSFHASRTTALSPLIRRIGMGGMGKRQLTRVVHACRTGKQLCPCHPVACSLYPSIEQRQSTSSSLICSHSAGQGPSREVRRTSRDIHRRRPLSGWSLQSPTVNHQSPISNPQSPIGNPQSVRGIPPGRRTGTAPP